MVPCPERCIVLSVMFYQTDSNSVNNSDKDTYMVTDLAEIMDTVFFVKGLIAQTVYTMYTKINYTIVPVTSFNKCLHNGTSGTE